METAIDYLNQVYGDLLDVAKRDRARLQQVPGRPPRRTPPMGLVAAGVSVLVVAGLIGSGIFGGSEAERRISVGGGETGASTGATGGAHVGTDEDAVVAFDPTLGGIADLSGGAGEAPTADLTQVIRTAEISVVIPRDSFDQRFGEAVDAAEAGGGFVADSRSQNRSGSLTLRVPAESFDETLRVLRALGTVEVESVHGKDVTADYVDLGARLRIAKARREVLLGLMQEATTIEQTIRVQNALDETQLDIEQLQGELRLLDDRTSLATIHVELREQGVEQEAEVETPSIPNALERAIAGAIGVVAAIVIGLGYVLPLLALGLAGWFVSTHIRRRRGGA